MHGLKIAQAAEFEKELNQITGCGDQRLFAVRRADVLLLGTAKAGGYDNHVNGCLTSIIISRLPWAIDCDEYKSSTDKAAQPYPSGLRRNTMPQEPYIQAIRYRTGNSTSRVLQMGGLVEQQIVNAIEANEQRRSGS